MNNCRQPENDNRLFENSIKYLHSISNMAGLNVPTLKSFYSTKGRLIEIRKGIYLPSNITRTSARCRRCCINLLAGPARYRIIAEQRKSKFARKLLAKCRSDRPLTKYQREYLKRCNNFNGNQLAVTCGFCKKESHIKLQKPKKITQPKISKVLKLKKKKNRKKDKFCGLRQEVVLSLTPQNIRNSNNLAYADTNKKSNEEDKPCERSKETVITSHNIRDLDSSYISVNTNGKKTSTFRLSKKENLQKNRLNIAKGRIKENKHKLQKKNKNLHKLSEFLSTSEKPKASPSANLKHFLQSL